MVPHLLTWVPCSEMAAGFLILDHLQTTNFLGSMVLGGLGFNTKYSLNNTAVDFGPLVGDVEVSKY